MNKEKMIYQIADDDMWNTAIRIFTYYPHKVGDQLLVYKKIRGADNRLDVYYYYIELTSTGIMKYMRYHPLEKPRIKFNNRLRLYSIPEES